MPPGVAPTLPSASHTATRQRRIELHCGSGDLSGTAFFFYNDPTDIRMDRFDAIFILGPQGSGKGTQQKLLAEKLGFHIWDTGKVLREHREVVTVTGKTVGEIMNSGALLTDEELLGVVQPLMQAVPNTQGILF